MRLIKVKAWADKTFVDGSRPSASTIAQWIRTGELPGAIIGGSYFVDDNYCFKTFSSKPTKQEERKLAPPPSIDLKKRLWDAGITVK